MVRAFNKLSAPMQRRIRLMVSRGTLNLVNDETKLQEVQVTLLADEVRDKVERVQDYGFSSNPHPGGEVISVCVGGSRDHCVIIKVEDRRYRFKGLKGGEAVLYSDEGDAIHLRRGREIHVTAGTKLVIHSPLVEFDGDLNVKGDISADGTIIDGTGNTNHHSH